MLKGTDQKLVEKLLKGDEKAFSDFFNDYFPRLFHFACAGLWNDENLAEEAAQNAMSKVVQKLEGFRGESTLFTWMCAFCRHEMGAIIKRERKLGTRVSLSEPSELVDSVLACVSEELNDDPLLNYQKHQLSKLVHLTKTHLPKVYSDILEWKYLNGESVKEIACKLGRRPKAAESLLTRARVAFKEAYLVIIDDSNVDTQW